jgi:hypothetical protein
MSADMFTHGTLHYTSVAVYCSAREGAARALLRWISQRIDEDQMWLQFVAY